MTRDEMLKVAAVLGTGAMLPKGLMAALMDDPEIRASDFGKDFVWGTATAAYQIEGGWNEDGKGESIWDHFVHHTRKVKTHETGDIACDFYHRYESDIELMRQLNLKASRFSIGWSRVLPNGTGAVNQKGIDFYNRVIDKALKEGVEPWVTCYHWDLPQALQEKGGWTNRDVISWFEEYVGLCAKNYGDRVKNWMVFNEPMAFTALGYLLGIHAPGKIGFNSFFAATHHTVMSHGAGGRILRDQVKGGNIGTTFSCSSVDGWKGTPANMRAAKRAEVMINRLFIEPVLGMGYAAKQEMPALRKIEKFIKEGDEQKMKFDFDFIGVQNYTRTVAKNFGLVPMIRAINIPTKKLGHPVTEMGWEVYPEGMYRIIKEFAAYKGVKKIYITENGAAFKDEMIGGEIHDTARIQFIKDYLKNVLKAKREGIDIGGYFVWSFLDNFEWAEGNRPKFGLVSVDYQTQKRTVKDSGKWFAEFLKS